MAKRALVIGINAYVDPWQLNGAVNDAQLMAGVLEEKFEFPKENIRLLTDADATKDGILGALDDLIDATQADDVVVFFYAGHGSRLKGLPKVQKATGYTTALCPVDETNSPTTGYFILDDELHERLGDLAEHTSYVTVIIDACHSATVTRDIFGDRVRNMSTEPVTAEYKIHQTPRRRAERAALGGETGPSGWLSLSDTYVLIAGCRDDELSNEVTAPGTGAKHGALTFFLTQELKNATSGMTYRDVFERAAASVTARKPGQHPQMEGRIDRAIFGVTDLAPMDFARIVSRTKKRVVVNRGAAHGVTVDSIYDVYPQGTKRIPSDEDAAGQRLGTISIVSVGAVQSEARVESEVALEAIEPDTRAFETTHVHDVKSAGVAIVASGTEPETVDAIQALRNAVADVPILRVLPDDATEQPFARIYLIAPRTSVGPADPAPSLGVLRKPRWAAVGTTGEVLFDEPLADGYLLAESLRDVVKYTQALELRNQNPRSELQNKFKLELLRQNAGGEWVVAESDRAGGIPVYEDKEAFALRITNQHTQSAAYINLLDFQEGWGLSVLFPPRNGADPLPAKGVFEHGMKPDGSPLWEADGEFDDDDDSVTERRETIKLFATSTPADFRVLEQGVHRELGDGDSARPGADSPLTALFSAVVGSSSGTRAVKERLPEKDPNDWATATASFVIRRKTPLTAEGQRITKSGAILRAAGVEGDAVVHPAGSSRVTNAAITALSAAVSSSGGEIVQAIEVNTTGVDEGTRDASTPKIELDVPVRDDAVQMLLRTDENGLITFHFPTPAERTRDASGDMLRFEIPVAPARAEEATRDLSSLVNAVSSSEIGKQFLTLVVYPAAGTIVGLVGETLAQQLESRARPYRIRSFLSSNYTSADAPALESKDWANLAAGRTLLLLHDLFDQSHGAFSAMPAAYVADLQRVYGDRVIAFDHYTLSHDPRVNAKRFINEIALPDGRALDVDIIAHGRGGLVARALAAMGGDRVRVHNVVFVGTPQAGTPFADVRGIEKSLNRYSQLASITLTHFMTPMVGGLFNAAKSALFGMAAALEGLDAMKPDSKFLTSLKASATAASDTSPRAFAVASNFDPMEPGLVARLRNLLSDKTITGDNDLVVSTVSALELPADFQRGEKLTLDRTDGVAHAEYFDSVTVRSRILGWLTPRV